MLDLTGITSFADYFVICTGANQRQIQAISEEVNLQLKHQNGELPISLEGYNQAEWVLLDYVDFVVHVFSEKARKFYDLERLWKSAKRLTASDLRARKSRASPPSSAAARAPRSRTRKS